MRSALAAAACLLLLAFAVTLDRVPIEWADEVLYASTARAIQAGEGGVPTMLAYVPGTPDHVRFYGPVFFRLAAIAFDLFGVSPRSFRLVSLLGILLIAVAGMRLAAACGQSRERQWLSGVWLLLTPTVGSAATTGRMDTLAVGLALLGLATFAAGLKRGTHAWSYGAATGVCLAAAALTVPRIWLLLVACGLTALARPRLPLVMRRHASVQCLVAWGVVAIAVAGWSTLVHGGPVAWLAYVTFIGTNTVEESTIAPGAVRAWALTPWGAITPAFIALALVALVRQAWRTGRGLPSFGVATLPLLAMVVNAALALWVVNLTFTFSIYFTVPLLAVLLALPEEAFGVNRRALVAVAGLVLALNVGVRTVKYAGVAATWEARNPAAVARFVQAHVPPGATVFGRRMIGFYATEQAGAHFHALVPESWADWTKAARRIQPPAPREPHAHHAPGPTLLLWPAEDLKDLPAAAQCAVAGERLGLFTPPPYALGLLAPVAGALGLPGYPALAIYQVPPGCRLTL